MSYTNNIKNEVCTLETCETENITELSAIISNSIEENNLIKIITENVNVAERIYSLIKDIFHKVAQITVRKGYNFNKKMIYILSIDDNNNIIKESLGLFENNNKLIEPKAFILDDDDLTRSYLRGVFLICGSINDPQKSRYHLEFFVNNEEYSLFVLNLLNKYNLNCKKIKKDNRYMLYIKEAEKISDFLRIIKAFNALLYFENIRIYRDNVNMTNRLNNCEQANVDKMIETANNQVKDIELINKSIGLDILSPKERIVADYRLKYREVPLVELSEIISYETNTRITKSGVYHRLNKIKIIADRIRNNKNTD